MLVCYVYHWLINYRNCVKHIDQSALLSLWNNWAQQKRYRIADFFKVVDKELSTKFHAMFDMSPFYFGWYLVAFVLARRWTLSVFCTKWSRRHLREPCLLRKASCCWSPAVVESCSRAALYAGCDTKRRLAGIFSECWVRLTRRNCPMPAVHISSEVAAPACPAQNVVCLGLHWTLALPTLRAGSVYEY